jgi:hypothetical protein
VKKGALLTLLILSLDSFAMNEEGSYATLGQGTRSCGSVIEIYESKDEFSKRLIHEWINGYLTALNYSKSGVYNIAKGVDLGGRSKWIQNYCNENPLKQLATAVEVMAHELENR